ncbi:MAG: flagellar export chaperone FlgN [Bacteroidetes bacterium]|nr:flagellar export chaperone FlgN [Bacteroidota bacterium]
MVRNKIIEYLQNTIQCFVELNSVYVEKQKLLIKYNYDGFIELTKKEELILSRIQQEEKLRLKLKEELLISLNLPKEKLLNEKFSTIMMQRLKKEEVEEIVSLELELKAVLEQSRNLNQNNMFLLEHKKQFITEMFKVLFAGKKQNFINRKM